ncbi:hypothetical protein FJR75_08205 [Thermus thermophilus]|nr:hypothetical protein [Thermus thermophilus]
MVIALKVAQVGGGGWGRGAPHRGPEGPGSAPPGRPLWPWRGQSPLPARALPGLSAPGADSPRPAYGLRKTCKCSV